MSPITRLLIDRTVAMLQGCGMFIGNEPFVVVRGALLDNAAPWISLTVSEFLEVSNAGARQ